MQKVDTLFITICLNNQDYAYSWFAKILAFNASSRAINYARSVITGAIAGWYTRRGAAQRTYMYALARLGVIARSIYNAPYLRPWLNIVARWLPRNDDPASKETALVDKSSAREHDFSRPITPPPRRAAPPSPPPELTCERYLKRD